VAEQHIFFYPNPKRKYANNFNAYLPHFTIRDFCLGTSTVPQPCGNGLKIPTVLTFDTYDTIKLVIAMQTKYYDLYIFICSRSLYSFQKVACSINLFG